MKRVTKYHGVFSPPSYPVQANDGKEFDTEVDAHNHEMAITAMKSLQEVLNASLSTGRPDSVLKSIIANANEVRTILRTYNKRLRHKPASKKKRW